MQIFLLHIDHYLDKDVILQKMKTWPINIQGQVKAFQQQKDYNATFLGKLLLIYVFKKNAWNWDWDQLQWTSKDKPYLKNSDIHFNISHSGDYVMLGIHSEPIGVDIEHHRPVKIELFNRQFQANEWKSIHEAEVPLKKFFQFWSIKESAIKADGRGMEILSKTEIIKNRQIQVEDKVWSYQSFDLVNGYAMAVCSESLFYFSEEEVEMMNTGMLLGHRR